MLTGLKSRWFILLISFFVLHFVSGLVSENKSEGLRMIEQSSGFLGFPYFLFLFTFSSDTLKKIISAFVSGCFFALVACLFRAAFKYFFEGENYFYYNHFSYFMHAGYFSMYLLFAAILAYLIYPVWFTGDKKLYLVRIPFLLLFVIGIILCASKIGIIAMGIVTIILIILKFKERYSLKGVLLVILTSATLIYAAILVFPGTYQRLKASFETATSKNIDKTSSESTAVRMLIWKECREIISENILSGTGAGDANDVLLSKYREKGLTGALDHNLNAHNQFFQTFIGTGIIGFCLILMFTAGALVYSVLKRNHILFLFSVIIILNFLVESMLQTQAGNLFFVFFLSLLLKYDLVKIENNTPSPSCQKV